MGTEVLCSRMIASWRCARWGFNAVLSGTDGAGRKHRRVSSFATRTAERLRCGRRGRTELLRRRHRSSERIERLRFHLEFGRRQKWSQPKLLYCLARPRLRFARLIILSFSSAYFCTGIPRHNISASSIPNRTESDSATYR